MAYVYKYGLVLIELCPYTDIEYLYLVTWI